MLMPPALFNPISAHFNHHTVWHAARYPGQEELRQILPGECGGHLSALDQVGSGCDFLKFHRTMMRHFFFLLETVEVAEFRWLPWDGPRLPAWVEAAVLDHEPGFPLTAAYGRIATLVESGDIETLGAFVEANHVWKDTPGASLHNTVHRAIGALESSMYGGDETSPMEDLGRAPGNVFFWLLHDWIDRRYAECQEAAGEDVDRSPSEMLVHMHTLPEGVTLPPLD